MCIIYDLGVIQSIRQSKGYTQEYVAKKIDKSVSYISKLERFNRSENPTLQVIIDIANVFDVCPFILLTCNCSECEIKKDEMERLKCKKDLLDMLSRSIVLSSEIVENEIENFDKLGGKLTYGDSKHIRGFEK